MPQPRSTSRQGASKPAARSTAKRAGAKTGAAKRSTGAKRSPAAKRATTANRTATANRTTTEKPRTAPRRSPSPARPDELFLAAIAAVRNSLTRGIVLTGERLQEAVDDSVRRGRMTRDDAEDLAQSLIEIGRRQSQELLSELESLTGAGRVRDRALREVDRARRATRLSTFPVTGYDQLSAGQVTARLKPLGAPELRKVRDYERRHANRKSVISAIEKQLGR